MKANYDQLDHFSRWEFDCPTLPGSGDEMEMEFLDKLQTARRIAKTPFNINSGFRTPAYNKRIGGIKGSSHTKGRAADIRISNSRQRFKILTSLIQVGFSRIGIYSTFIHVDFDTDKDQMVIWTPDEPIIED